MVWIVLCCSAATAAPGGDGVPYVVQPGDHLWSIAQRYLQQPRQALKLAQANHVAHPQRLQPGTVLQIPAAWLREQPAPVQLLAVSGEVLVQPADAPARAATVGEALLAPARLSTGAQGSVSLGFADGSRALLLRGSELQVLRSDLRLLDQAGMVSLKLLRGSLENEVPPRAETGRRYEIRTPAAIAAVRGTRFRVHSAGPGPQAQARTEVLAGAVQFANPAGTVLAQAGQGSLAQRDTAPAPPVPLLPPPSTAGLPQLVERWPAQWAFTPLAGAATYRVQLASDAGFATVVLDQQLPTPRLQLPAALALPDGRYWLRLRGIDALGLEGDSAEQALQVRTQPAPPLMLEPASDAQLIQPQPRFQWTENPDSLGYQLQLYAQDVQAPYLDVRTEHGAYQPPQPLPLGRYRWRVAGVGRDGAAGPFGEAQAFVRAEPGPAATLAAAQEPLVLRWNPQAGAAGYQLELSSATPAAPVLDLRADEPSYPLPPLPPATYQVRVRTVGADGVPGPWGEPQDFAVPEPVPPHWPRLLLLLPLVLL
ncbi:FecR family protein [Pseudorhodoferax sp.]|uniref:FecR family protein n=1 Tax=Pseudorhodoferax sp. TaxID=1993553 RepID=UPI002DD6604E|nr:FecR domain-containing protein [Pseudorhodoferax sp.]